MKRALLLSFLPLIAYSLAYSSDELDLMAPLIMARLGEVTSTIIPVPKLMMGLARHQIARYFFLTDSKSELCRNHSDILFNAFLENEIWAFKMFDANSKIGSGLMDGNIQDLGSYDQCVSVEAPSGLFQGQHCVVETRGLLPETLMDSVNYERENAGMIRIDFMFSLCVPSSCTAKDVKGHFDAAWESINGSAILFNSSCSSAKIEPLESQDLGAIWVLLSLSGLVLGSTVYELFVKTKDRIQVFTSFSLCRNIRQLFAADENPDSMHCIYGLRVIALTWIVLGHRLFFAMFVPMTSFKGVLNNISSFWWAPIQVAALAVEIFFLMSGLLMSYNFMKAELKGIKFNYFSFFFNRYKRLTPSLALAVLLSATIAIRFSDGPIWSRLMKDYQESCQNKWWANLLYINNYYRSNDPFQCVPQSWYLAADFQMHMLAPILLVVVLKNKILGIISIMVCLTSTVAYTIVFISTNEVPAKGLITTKPFDVEHYLQLLESTHHRAGSFLIGMSLGYFIYKIKHENIIFKLNKVTLVVGWIISATLILAPFYIVTLPIVTNFVYDPWFDPAYSALHGPLASVGVSWIILVCTLGHGGTFISYVNKFLSWKALVPLSRLSYGTYLVHILIQQVLMFSTRENLHIDTFTPWLSLPLDFLLSNILSAVLYVTVEAPFSNLLFKRSKSKKPEILPK